MNSNNSSGFKGVSWYKSTGRWKAQIMRNGIKKSIGYFDSPTDAANAYDRAASAHFGEFAKLNFPKELGIS